MGEHVFLDYMSFRITCLIGAHVLREVMFCRRKFLEMSCVGGVYIFKMAYLTMCCVSLKDMSSWKTCLLESMCYSGTQW